MHALVIGLEPVAPEQDMQSPISEAPPFTRQFDQTLLESIARPLRDVVQHAAGQAEQATGAAFGQIELGPHGADGDTPRLRAQNFPRATAFNASLSSMASATSFLMAFSASKALKRLTSGTSIPPSLHRHR